VLLNSYNANVGAHAVARLRVVGFLTFAAASFYVLSPIASAAEPLGWDYQPYRIHAIVAVDLPGGIAEQVGSTLPTYLERRVVAGIGPLWSVHVELATGDMRHRVLTQLAAVPTTPPADVPLNGIDKIVFISVTCSADGYDLAAREYDTFVERWSTTLRREIQQAEALPESVFALLCDAVSPLAEFDVVPDDEKRVSLRPRGAALMRAGGSELWARPGDVLLPILRRTTRSGQLVEDGIRVVPWTYLQVDERKEDEVFAEIKSGTRRPFGIRRQGRVEQIAIVLRPDPAETILKLRSRITDTKPLVGYEIFAQNDPKKPESLARLGATDRNGTLAVPPAKNALRTIFIKNGGRMLARLPVVPGLVPEIDVPLPDDDARLAAETQLSALREDLIDVVARRNILMARVRQKIKDKDFEGAEKLLAEINELPGRSQFNLELTSAARRMRSNDPQIQRRIDHLFEGTQAALTQYLDTRPISELSAELRAAQEKKGG
jgi:hypothetical protein